MSKYIRQADRVAEPEESTETLKRRLYGMQQCMDQMTHAMHNIGLYPQRPSGSSTQLYFNHVGLRSCKCGRAPRIIEDPYERGTWVVICPECLLVTEGRKKILQAMKDWQAGKFTEDSQMIQEKLTAERMDDGGAEALVDAIRRQACDDYIVSLQTGRGGDREIEKCFPERTAGWRRLWAAKEKEKEKVEQEEEKTGK